MDDALRAVADPTRRAILRLVRDGEQPAGEIARHFPSMTRPAVSQHLRVLTDAGLLEVRPEGNRRLYSLRPEGLRDAVTFLEEMWTDGLCASQARGRARGVARAHTKRPREEEGAMNERDTGVVEQTLRIRARPQTVWRYWTEPDRMCAWWGEVADLDPRPGGICRVQARHGGTMVGEYVELVPYERIVFTFGWEPAEGAPDVPPGSTRVEVSLVEEASDTIMTVRHTGLPASEADKHDEGWGHFLPLLVEAVKEGY